MPDERMRPLGSYRVVAYGPTMRAASRSPRTFLSETQLLAVSLKGGRSYVQGSQQLARAAEVLGATALGSCGFRRLTDRRVRLAVLDGGAPLPDDRLGEAVFVVPGLRQVAFLEDAGEAPCAPEAAGFTLTPDDDCTVPLEGRFHFAQASSFEARLEVVISAIRQLHEPHLAAGEHAIFTGLRGASLACALRDGSGALRVGEMRVLRGATGWQSMARVELVQEGLAEAFVASFAVGPRNWRDAA